MVILGIESTCDETGVAIVANGRKILASIVASSVEFHKKYHGVVPEVAAREQIRCILPVIAEATANAAETPNSKLKTRNSLENKKMIRWVKKKIDAIAIAHGPGLIGSLLVGVETAKALALAWDKPLIPVNHLIGHLYANWLLPISNLPKFPLVALIVSGGHTDLILMVDHSKFKWLGGTLDDAGGEVFDKVARVLGLSYPGGPEIERIARKLETGNSKLETKNFKLPMPMIDSGDFDFSFSGLKTAVVNIVKSLDSKKLSDEKTEIAHEFQKVIVDVLVTKTFKAAKEFYAKSIVVGGGVAANSTLRRQMSEVGSEHNIKTFFPTKELSIDNGAMIAAAAFFNKKVINPLKLQADPSLYFSTD